MGQDALADEILKEKASRRAALRAEYWKQVTSPYRHGTGEGGHIFDPAIQRYISTKSSQWDYFKPTAKTSRYALGLTIIPMLIYGYFVHKERSTREAQIRSGQIAYRDRLFKFI